MGRGYAEATTSNPTAANGNNSNSTSNSNSTAQHGVQNINKIRAGNRPIPLLYDIDSTPHDEAAVLTPHQRRPAECHHGTQRWWQQRLAYCLPACLRPSLATRCFLSPRQSSSIAIFQHLLRIQESPGRTADRTTTHGLRAAQTVKHAVYHRSCQPPPFLEAPIGGPCRQTWPTVLFQCVEYLARRWSYCVQITDTGDEEPLRIYAAAACLYMSPQADAKEQVT